MKNIIEIVIILFKNLSPASILEGKPSYRSLGREEFGKLAAAYEEGMSPTEIDNLYHYMVNAIHDMDRTRRRSARVRDGKLLNVFDPLFLVTDQLLLMQEGKAVCHYEALLSWRRLTMKLDEDFLVTAFYAEQDLFCGYMRNSFRWNLITGHNNTRINKLVEQGVSENHFHLWGSTPFFQLSWIQLMNEIMDTGFLDALRELDHKRQRVSVHYDLDYREAPFEIQHMQAVLIRLYLLFWLRGEELELEEYQIDSELYLRYHPAELKLLMKQINISDVLEKQGGMVTIRQAFFDENKDNCPGKQCKEFFHLLLHHICGICGKNEWEAWKQRTVWDVYCLILREHERIPVKYLRQFIPERQYQEICSRKTLECVEALLRSADRLAPMRVRLQAIINTLRYSCGDATVNYADYMLLQVPTAKAGIHSARRYLEGERWFLYQMFRLIYDSKEEYPRQFNLFYAYLLLKENLRGEMLQVNSRVGLQNFLTYQDRKKRFIHSKRLEDALVQMAVLDTLRDERVVSMELRISPQDSAVGNAGYIRHLDQVINEDGEKELEKKYYYVLHFIKEEDKRPAGEGICRHALKRAKVKKEACALAEFRDKYPLIAGRVLGIDAASQEIGCRPEVFSQAYRFLKAHTPRHKEKGAPLLKATYHAGEDFLDILDGLRAIEEAVLFCNLDCGDRLGHAMALGLDVDEWYRSKGYTLYLPKQDYLDNLAWLYGKLVHYGMEGFDNLKTYIQAEFERYFKIVYIDRMDMDLIKDILGNEGERRDQEGHRLQGIGRNTYLNYDIRTYYNAWKLRGDSPECYKKGYFENTVEYGNSYDGFAVNSHLADGMDVDSLRYIPEVAILYYTYHFNKDVKREGSERIAITISPIWAAGVAAVQKKVQRSIQNRGIAIETNPSSNVLISTFQSYEKHPITALYNNHLTYDTKSLEECPQVSVSINTDDKEIFSTSLENEYALMACSLEMARHKDGTPLYNQTMIYEWLNEVRKMGNVQAFRDDTTADGRTRSGAYENR